MMSDPSPLASEPIDPGTPTTQPAGPDEALKGGGRSNKLPAWAVATVFGVVGILIGVAATGIPLSVGLAGQQSEIKVLTAQKNRAIADRDHLSEQLSSATAQAQACQSKVNALNTLIAATSNQLTSWGADPFGYTIDTSQITSARDAANTIVGC